MGPDAVVGPYARLRNPLYVGNLLLFAGIGVIQWPSALLCVPLLALYHQGPAKLAGLEKGLNRQGAAARQAEKQQKGLSGAWDKAKASLENVMISLGKGLAPGLSDGLTHLAGVISQQVQNGNLERFGSLLGSLISLGAELAGAFIGVQGALQHIFDGPKAALDVFLGALSTIGDAIVSIIDAPSKRPSPSGVASRSAPRLS